MKLPFLLKITLVMLLLSPLAGTSPAQSISITNIDLVDFSAVYHEGQILVTWETATELDNAGFYVNRNTTSTPPYTRISDFIPAEGSGVIGATYDFVDDDIVQGETYYYLLQSVDTDQNITLFGPISAYAGHRIYLPFVSFPLNH